MLPSRSTSGMTRLVLNSSQMESFSWACTSAGIIRPAPKVAIEPSKLRRLSSIRMPPKAYYVLDSLVTERGQTMMIRFPMR